MSDLPPNLADLFAAERSAPSPGDDAQRAVRARLGVTLGIATAATASSGSATAATAKLTTLKIVTVVVGLIGIGAIVRYATSSSVSPPRAALVERAEPIVVEEQRVDLRVEPPTVETTPRSEAPQPAVAPVTVHKRSQRVVAVPAAATPPAPPPAPSTTPAAPTQVALLHDATTALPSDPARTLELVDEDARAHATGPLAEEREALRIHALVALGRTSDARTAAQQLLTRFPTTVHRALAERTLSLTEATK
ncbi:MAG TPA: hypothetical protein VGM39_00100 [Kofleriaceae bacterium]|jgi:hypothetical protein